MKVISFRDLMVCDELAHIRNEVELLNIENDHIVENILSQIGFNTHYGVAYIPSKHRDLKGNVAVGFQATGEVSTERSFLSSKLCSAEDRIIAVGKHDPSFAQELSAMSAQSGFAYAMEAEALEQDVASYNDDTDVVEEDYEFVLQQIKQLEQVREIIRGSLYNESGDIKRFSEYKK